jgi:hypothetical protein
VEFKENDRYIGLSVFIVSRAPFNPSRKTLDSL